MTEHLYRVRVLPYGDDEGTEVQYSTDDYDQAARQFLEWLNNGKPGCRVELWEGPNNVTQGAVRSGVSKPFPVMWGRMIEMVA